MGTHQGWGFKDMWCGVWEEEGEEKYQKMVVE